MKSTLETTETMPETLVIKNYSEKIETLEKKVKYLEQQNLVHSRFIELFAKMFDVYAFDNFDDLIN